MANEFVIKHGFISKGDSIVNGTISGDTLNLTTIPDLNLSATEILVRNSATGVVERTNVGSIVSGDTFVTGFTYDNSNKLTISLSDGLSFDATINQVSGLTVNGTLSATTLDGNTILSGGTNLLSIIDDRDNYVTGTTFGGNQAILTRNDGTEVFKLSGSSTVQLTNPSSNKIDIDVTIPPGMNTFVTGFTYDDINTFTITDNLGTAFTASINVLSATTISGGTLYGDGSNLTGVGGTFTGNTSASCITDLWVTNISGCSPVTIGTEVNINGNLSVVGSGSSFVTINGSLGQELKINDRGNNNSYTNPNVWVGKESSAGAVLNIGSTGSIGSYHTGSFQGLQLRSENGKFWLFNNTYGGQNNELDLGSGDIKYCNSISSHPNYALKLYGGPGPNDQNDGLQVYTADSADTYTLKLEIKSDITNPDAYFTNIGGLGINTTSPSHTLDVSGTTKTINFQMTSGATSGYILTSDAIGNASWELLSGGTDTNTFVTGGTYNDSTDIITFTNTTGGTFNVTGITDTFVTGGTYNPGTVNLDFSGNSGFSSFSIDVSALKDDTNTFVTGFTYDNNNTFTINDNIGSAFTATINQVSGLTVNGTISATTLDGNTILSGGTNLLSIIDDRDNYVTGTTFGSNQSITTRNDDTDILKISGGTNVTLSNPSSNQIKIDVSIPADTNTFVTGGTYNASTNTITLGRNDDVDLSISGLTDSFVTGATLNGTTLELERNEGLTTLTVDLSSIDTDTFVTGGTYNAGTVNLDFSGNTGFSPFSVDVSALKDDTNTYVTGFTYNDANIFTISDNSGSTFNATINQVSGLTVNGTLSATTLDGNTILSGGTNLLTIIDDRDTFVTGTTFGSNQSITTRNDDTDILKISGGTNVTLSNPASNQIKIDVPLLQNQFLLDIYQSGTTELNETTYTSIDWDAQAILGSNYSHTPGGTNITINSTGTYQITYSISIGATNTFNQRMISRSRLSVGGVEIPRSGGFSYHRTTAQDEGTTSKTIITSLNDTDVITLDAIKFTSPGSSNELSTIAGDSNITITKLNDG